MNTGHDETSISRAELAALRQSEENFRKTAEHLAKIVNSSLDVICTFDAEGRFTQVSAASERVWGYKPEELIGTNFIELVHPDDKDRTRAVDTRILAGEPTINFENRYIRKDGAVVHMRWSAWWSEADKANFCVAHDVTGTRTAELTAIELNNRLELAAKASNVGIWDWNLATGILHWDDQMYELFGSTRSGSNDGLILWEQHLHPDDKERAEAEFQDSMRPGGPDYNTLFRIINPQDGRIRHIHGQGRVFRDQEGLPIRVLGTSRDATEQVLREESLRQKLEDEGLLLQRARAGEKAKSEFLATMSHEIRTPMNGVIGFAEMLVQSPALTPEDREIARTILSSGEALLRILDDVLDFSRIEAGRFAIEKRPCSPKEIAQGIDSLFRRQIERKGLVFVVFIADNVPETVEADAGRIRQVLVNLVGNAFKFTDLGTIHLTVNLIAAEGQSLQFVVRDTGAGISPGRAMAIFDAFTQEDSSISRRHGGTGLGLSISRRLAELMDGDLQMTSVEGEGSTFILRVPVDATDVPTMISPVEIEQLDGEFSRAYDLRILVVDDDPVNLRLIVSVLKKLGFDPFSARNGEEAISVFTKNTPDCVLMDMQMPSMDGIQATRHIRAMEAANGTPSAFIVALTANIHQEDRDRCFAAGMNTYLNKPVKRQAIAQVLVKAAKFRKGNLVTPPNLHPSW